MAEANSPKPCLVVPCSGIGKVHGLIAREAVYRVADVLLPDRAETLCLALLVAGDADTRRKVRELPCIAVDGCPKLCARQNIELSGGRIARGVRVYDIMKQRRGARFGSPSALDDDGWAVVDELAADIAATIRGTPSGQPEEKGDADP